MLYGLVLLIHIAVSLILVGVILLQGGRGGLSETLGGAAAQSLFGGRTATVLTRLTAGCAMVFVVTCLSLAYLSTARGRSIIEQMPAALPESLPLPGVPAAEAPTAAPADAAQPPAPSEPAKP